MIRIYEVEADSPAQAEHTVENEPFNSTMVYQEIDEPKLLNKGKEHNDEKPR